MRNLTEPYPNCGIEFSQSEADKINVLNIVTGTEIVKFNTYDKTTKSNLDQ